MKSLVPVLNDSEKAVLLHQICLLLPSKVQDEFDETAANVLSEGLIEQVIMCFDT